MADLFPSRPSIPCRGLFQPDSLSLLRRKKLTSKNRFSASCLKFQFLNSNPSGRIGDSILSFLRGSHPSCIFSIHFFSLRDPPGDDSGSSHSPGFRIPQFFGPKDAAQHSPFLECGVERSVCPDWANRIIPDLEKCFFRDFGCLLYTSDAADD